MDEFGLESLKPVSEEIIGRSEAAVRGLIRELPDGEYHSETWTDGFEEPIVIRCCVRVEDDRIFIDFAGIRRRRARAGSTWSSTTPMPMPASRPRQRCIRTYRTTRGSFRPVHVTAAAATILNALHPAPVASRQAGRSLSAERHLRRSGGGASRSPAGAERGPDLAQCMAGPVAALYDHRVPGRRHGRAARGRMG